MNTDNKKYEQAIPMQAPTLVGRNIRPTPLADDDDEKDEFEKKLERYMSRRTFADKMIAANKSAKRYQPHSFGAELNTYWFLYAFLAVSAVFTLTLGVFMGLAPKRLENGDIFFHTDPAHLLLSLVYGMAFVAVTEFAFALGKRLFYIRESGNFSQSTTMIVMMIIAGVSILGTGIAGGIVVASTIDFLSAFVTIPEWAQYWVVRVIPGLIVLYSFLLTVYALSSKKAETERIIRDRVHQHELDQEMRRRTLEQYASEEIEKEALKLYMKQIEEGKISVAEAISLARSGNVLDAIAADAAPKKGKASGANFTHRQ